MNYLEKETKVLDVNKEEVIQKLKEIGAEEVFNDSRTITHFDTPDTAYLAKGKIIKLTEEGKLKLSVSENTEEGTETVKLMVSRKQEAVDLLKKLDLIPVAESTSHRTSYEWEGIDFDIDEFPQLRPFLEIDLGDSKYSLEEVLQKLGLENSERGEMSTPDIYQKNGLNYFETFKL